jgi:hypothetical protein
MAFDKTNTGTLSRNKDKDPNNPAHEKWADAKGTINIDGVEYWLDGWLKNGDNGRWTSLKVRRKEAKQGTPPGTNKTSVPQDDSDVPF